MLVTVTSLADPDLSVLLARPEVAVVVPAHLSKRGWLLEDGDAPRARLITSRGPLEANQCSGVWVRVARVTAGDLLHVDATDRDYVAAEMTAFLAAMLTSLACPVFNRPTATSLVGLAWNQQHWWRAAARNGLATCTGQSRECQEGVGIVILDGQPLLESEVAEEHVQDALRFAAIARVRLVRVELCRVHGKVRRASLTPRLTERLLEAIEKLVGAECAIP